MHLNPPALAVIASLRRDDEVPWLIRSGDPERPLTDLQKPWRRIRKNAGLTDVRIHDLRHSFASTAAASGFSLPIIGALLGHTQAATTARYAHLAADPLQQATHAIGKRIVDAMQSVGGADKVVSLRDRAS